MCVQCARVCGRSCGLCDFLISHVRHIADAFRGLSTFCIVLGLFRFFGGFLIWIWDFCIIIGGVVLKKVVSGRSIFVCPLRQNADYFRGFFLIVK